ncbi:hypothetical protein FRC01_003766 [Tulasnella sp. 417]|nr:hypothetical protein FRC01_003766 [Tulasnella sp. 417]
MALHAPRLTETGRYPSQADDESEHIEITKRALQLAEALHNIDPDAQIIWSRYPRINHLMATKKMQRYTICAPPQLPNEVFIEIIHCAAFNPQINETTRLLSDPTYFQLLYGYRRVSKHWRDVIDGAPMLWSFLSADTPWPAVVQRAIEKSRNVSVTISYGAGKLDLGQFIEMVAPQMHRCKALWMRSWPVRLLNLTTLQTLLEKECPLLEELHFHPGCGEWRVPADRAHSNTEQTARGIPHFDIWALRQNTHGLKSLSFSGVRSWRAGSAFANLQELKLELPWISAQELVESVAESPLLRSLVINAPRAGEIQDVVHAPTVELAFLTRMELLHSPASFAHKVLSHITPPCLNQLVISISEFDSPTFPLTDIGAEYQALILSLVEAQGMAPIPIHWDPFAAACSQARIRSAQYFADLSRCWDSASTGCFDLILSDEVSLPQENLKPLMDIAGISKIQVGEGVHYVHNLYRRLSYAVCGVAQSRQWLLPRLTVLEIEEQGEVDEALVAMLKTRYAAVGTIPGDIAAPLPFSQIKLVRYLKNAPRPEIFDAIKNIVGENQFCVEVKPNL